MPKFDGALRGYAFCIMQRDNFTCRYCGLCGVDLFSNWLSLSWDHLLPKGHPDRDDPNYIVTSCMFSNTADNQYFRQAARRGLKFDGMSQEELVEQRRPYVHRTRRSYKDFWEKFVQQT